MACVRLKNLRDKGTTEDCHIGLGDGAKWFLRILLILMSYFYWICSSFLTPEKDLEYENKVKSSHFIA